MGSLVTLMTSVLGANFPAYLNYMTSKALPLLLCALLMGCGGSGTTSSTSSGPRIGKAVTPEQLDLSINSSLMVPQGQFSRHRGDKMSPKYITIHSTQNPHASANARMHATALRHGRLKSRNNSLGYLSWHFSVDASTIYQSIPENEQGQHADYDGKGNRSSIGIEMCENRGNSLEATMERTARLCAYLMRQHRIPLDNIVPHQHWERIRYSDGRNLGHKNCPHFLMDNGQPGAKWDAFKQRVVKYL